MKSILKPHVSSFSAAISDYAETFGLSLRFSNKISEMINTTCAETVCATETELFLQNQLGDALYFLVSGEARFIRQANGEQTRFATVTSPMVPLGVSCLNSPGRYLSTGVVTKGSRYFSLPLKMLFDILVIDQRAGAQLMSFILSRATELLWATRSFTPPLPANPHHTADGVAFKNDRDIETRLTDTAFFAELNKERLPALLEFAELRLFASHEIILEEGQPNHDLIILFSGSIEASFSMQIDKKIIRKTRTIVRPGVALTWANGQCDLPAPYQLRSNRDTAILKFSSAKIYEMMTLEPLMASALFQRQIWQISRFQQSSSGLSNFADRTQSELLKTLIDYNGSKIPVQSPLHSATHMLDNRFTRKFAFDCIYEAALKGNDAERSVASLLTDALKPVEREHRFFEQLNKIYTRVTSAEAGANSSTLRQLTQVDFARAFDQIPYVIKGQEHLPDEPKTIFIYNHLAAVPENELANGHAFSLDSHFVSTKILYPKYGDGGQRIVRASRSTEFWRNGYYSRLDNIFVHTPESDRLTETDQQKADRKQSLYIEAERTFNQCRPIVIAPEGTSETSDNLTPTSPGPFKIGAFKLAATLTPEPVIVPIALANFDINVSQTIYSAVIKPPFRLSDVVDDISDEAQIEAFLDKYRKTFRGYVEEAIALADDVRAMPVEQRQLLSTNLGLVSPIEEEFGTDVREVEMHRYKTQTDEPEIVLYGSSTLRLWRDAKTDLGVPHLLNLAFGGATIAACQAYAAQLLQPLKTGTLVLYAGDNDLGNGMSVLDVIHDYENLIETIQEILPDFEVFVISLKPSPFRHHLTDKINEVNKWLKDFTDQRDGWQFIDIFSAMTEANGKDKSVFYEDDPLHMNDIGYAFLAKKIREKL